jgi:hypothetical protein
MSVLFFTGSMVSGQEIKTLCDDGTYCVSSGQPELKSNPSAVSPLACTSNSNLVTFYSTNNAQRGHMFDINATNCVTILCFEMNFSAGTSNVDIYTKTGTHVGFQSTAGAWTLIGSAANVTSAGVNVPTSIPIAVNQLIAAGTTRAFYITRTTVGGPTVAYTNGTAVGNVLASDANITLREGTGKEYLFSTNFAPRQFNGKVFYDLNPPCVLPIELSQFDVTKNGKIAEIKWTTSMEKNNDYFVIERSKDGKSFEAIKKVNVTGNSNSQKNYFENDNNPLNGISYYRLKQVDKDGGYSYSSLKTFLNAVDVLGDIVINPMPVKDDLNLEFNSEPGAECIVSIFDLAGKLIYSETILSETDISKTSINVSELANGMYFLSLENASNVYRKKFVKE